MTIDEAIKDIEEIAEENQRVVDTGIVFDDVTIDMLYCDDTEVIEEHLANYQKCAEEHRQLAEWLKELKRLREQTTWTPVNKRLPERDEEYNTFLVTDSDGNLSLSKFYFPLSNSDIDQPYWSGMVDVVAWMPSPSSYRGESEDKEGMTKYKDFCKFIAECIMQDDFEEEAGFYAEIICRKLYKLGIVDKDDKNWIIKE